MSQDSWTMRKRNMRISWVWNMRNDHYEVRKKVRKHEKWGMKEDSTTWKFGTQNLMVTRTLTLRKNLEYFPKSILDILYISFRSSGSQESNASNDVQIKIEMNKLWPFEDNYAKLKGHFEKISKFNLWIWNPIRNDPNSNSPASTLMFHLFYLRNCI